MIAIPLTLLTALIFVPLFNIHKHKMYADKYINDKCDVLWKCDFCDKTEIRGIESISN